MSRPIKIKDDNLKEIHKRIDKLLSETNAFCYPEKMSLKLRDENDKATLSFTPKAWIKMTALVKAFSTEIQWHGTVTRVDKHKFLVDDILTFKHSVSNVTVISEQAEYNEWLNSLPDDVYEKIKMHGHSHVDMGVVPSFTDIRYRKDVIDVSGTPTEAYDIYQIFLILNKKGDIEAQIYDITNNVVYDTEDIYIDIIFEDGSTSGDFVKKTRSLVIDTEKAC